MDEEARLQTIRLIQMQVLKHVALRTAIAVGMLALGHALGKAVDKNDPSPEN